jgi:hypothetical protein
MLKKIVLFTLGSCLTISSLFASDQYQQENNELNLDYKTQHTQKDQAQSKENKLWEAATPKTNDDYKHPKISKNDVNSTNSPQLESTSTKNEKNLSDKYETHLKSQKNDHINRNEINETVQEVSPKDMKSPGGQEVNTFQEVSPKDMKSPGGQEVNTVKKEQISNFDSTKNVNLEKPDNFEKKIEYIQPKDKIHDTHKGSRYSTDPKINKEINRLQDKLDQVN